MKITHKTLFYLLTRKYSLTVADTNTESESVFLKSAAIYRGQYTGEGSVYIVTEEQLPEFRFYYGNIWIFICPDKKEIPIPDKYLPYCAVISSAVSPLQLLEDVFNLLVNLQEWDGLIKSTAVEMNSLNELFSVFQQYLPGQMIIIDRDFKVISYSKGYFSDTRIYKKELSREKVPLEVVNELVVDKEYRECEKNRDVFLFYQGSDPILICFNIYHEEHYIARFMLHSRSQKISQGELDLFRHISTYVQAAYIKYAGTGERRNHNDEMHQLCRSLMFHPDTMIAVSDMERVLQGYDWKMGDTYRVFCIRYTSFINFHPIAVVLQRELEERWKNSCVVIAEDQVVWIVNMTREGLLEDNGAFHKAFTYTIRELICKAGISNNFENFYYLQNYYKQSVLALELGTYKDPYLWSYHFKDYVLDYMNGQLTKVFTPEQLAHVGIVKLMQYDLKHETQYIETIVKYINAKFNASNAADRLYVHRTTFLKRLERIEELSGIRFENGKELLYILTSLELLNLLE